MCVIALPLADFPVRIVGSSLSLAYQASEVSWEILKGMQITEAL